MGFKPVDTARNQVMLMNFSSKKWTVSLLSVLIFLSIGVFITVSLGTSFWKQDFKSKFLASFSQNPFKQQSQVKVSLVDLKINFAFDLIGEDKPKFASFVRNWFGIDEEVKTLAFGIDENLKVLLFPNLPADLILKISEKSLEFKNQSLPGLQNALVKTDFDFATGSAKLSLKYSDPSRYELKIENPDELVFYATSSGILIASEKLEGLFKSLPQVATIELNVNGKNISGSIKLK